VRWSSQQLGLWERRVKCIRMEATARRNARKASCGSTTSRHRTQDRNWAILISRMHLLIIFSCSRRRRISMCGMRRQMWKAGVVELQGVV